MSDNIFNKWINGLEKTRKVAFGRIANLFGTTELTEGAWDELEAMLIQADLGVETTLAVMDALYKLVDQKGITRSDELFQALKTELERWLSQPEYFEFNEKPFVIMLVGVNGSGKTTSAAKLAFRYKEEGKSVLLVAADTYRAAAIDQLRVWADRAGVPLVAGQPGGEPHLRGRGLRACLRASSLLRGHRPHGL